MHIELVVTVLQRAPARVERPFAAQVHWGQTQQSLDQLQSVGRKYYYSQPTQLYYTVVFSNVIYYIRISTSEYLIHTRVEGQINVLLNSQFLLHFPQVMNTTYHHIIISIIQRRGYLQIISHINKSQPFCSHWAGYSQRTPLLTDLPYEPSELTDSSHYCRSHTGLLH